LHRQNGLALKFFALFEQHQPTARFDAGHINEFTITEKDWQGGIKIGNHDFNDSLSFIMTIYD